MQNKIPPSKVSQRVQLPSEFVSAAEADAKRVGLSLPVLLGLAARRSWQSTVESFIGEPMADADRKVLGLAPAGTARPNRKRGAL